MKNWDDHRFFLAVARQTSLKKAAEVLGVNRSTVLRRITAFEKELGVRLFDRLPNGYFTTAAGDEILESAAKMEAEASEVRRRIAGRDTRLSGTIRVSLSGPLATYVLMPDFAAFSEHHPDIKLELMTSYNMPDLDRREADVAIRISNDPPDDLVGRRIVKVARAVYMGAAFLTAEDNPHPQSASSLNWIGWSVDPSSMQSIEDSNFPDRPVDAVVTDPYATVKALEAGMGMSILPCYMGDSESGLCRIPGGNLRWSTDLWVLTHKDLRNTSRIRKFTDYISEALVRQRDLLEGNSERSQFPTDAQGT